MTGINAYLRMEQDYALDINWDELRDSPEPVCEITGLDRCVDCPEWCREDRESCPISAK